MRVELDQAAAAHRKAIELDPRAFGSYKDLALIYARQGKVQEALGAAAKAAELGPQDGTGKSGVRPGSAG